MPPPAAPEPCAAEPHVPGLPAGPVTVDLPPDELAFDEPADGEPPDGPPPREIPFDEPPAGASPSAALPRPALFELEGRAAPGLYLVAWALTILGLGSIFIAIASGGGSGAMLAVTIGVAALGLGLAGAAGSQALQRRADGAAYAGPSPVLVFAAAFALALVVDAVRMTLGVAPEGPPDVLASVLVSACLTFGLIALLVVSPGALRWRDMGFRLPGPGAGSALAELVLGIGLAIPTLFVAGTLAAILIWIVGVVPQPPLEPTRDPAGIVAGLIAAAVVAPLWEEGFFRGFATTAWARAAGPRAAIVRGALFFALVHVITLTGSDFGTAVRAALIAFLVRLPVGLVLGWVFLRRRTLIAPIALHATYNAIPVLLVALGAGTPAT